MATEFTGRGDPQRTMELLWGTAKVPGRGPKPGLSVTRIVGAAIALADSDGLAALSMRRVAERLGVGTMSLYTYVPSKAELLDVMMDTVLAEHALPDSATGNWRTRLELYAREGWALYRRHPWTLQVSGVRALQGPNALALYEASLAAVDGLGLSGGEMVMAVSTVGSFVRGAAQAAAEAEQIARQTNQTADEWWANSEPLLDKYFDAERYPTVVSVNQMGGFDPPENAGDYHLQHALKDFEFGLQRVLDGLEAYIARRQAEQPRQ